MNKCPHCGYTNPNKVSICINCGKSLYSSAETEQKSIYGLFEEENILKERYEKKNHGKIGNGHKYLNYIWDFFVMVVLWGIVLIVPCVAGFAKYYILIYLTVAYSIIFLWIEIMYLLLFNNTLGEFLFSFSLPWHNKWLFTILISFSPILFSLILFGIFKIFY